MRTLFLLTLSLLLVLGCTDPQKTTVPDVGYYPLASVDGQSLPAARTPNGCPASFTGGGANLTSLSFDIELAWTGSCPPSPPASSSWHCVGVPPTVITAEVEFSGLVTPGTPTVACTFRIAGYGDRLAGRFVGADSAIWGDPHFDLGPRQPPR